MIAAILMTELPIGRLLEELSLLCELNLAALLPKI
jgi:hypothetical protein